MLKGLSDNEEKELSIKHNNMGRGVYAEEAIFEKEYICEYKCKSCERAAKEREYINNGEGSLSSRDGFQAAKRCDLMQQEASIAMED